MELGGEEDAMHQSHDLKLDLTFGHFNLITRFNANDSYMAVKVIYLTFG